MLWRVQHASVPRITLKLRISVICILLLLLCSYLAGSFLWKCVATFHLFIHVFIGIYSIGMMQLNGTIDDFHNKEF